MKGLPGLIGVSLVLFAVGWLGVVAYSVFALGTFSAAEGGVAVPPELTSLAMAGQRVYAAQGCVACHTQQVRPSYLGADIDKKLGSRRTVARDYLRSQPAFLGSLRLGPDLANFGVRLREASAVHHQLFEPRTINAASLMPAYRCLYETRRIAGHSDPDALTGLAGPDAPAPGYEVVPTEDARALVAYLLSLQHDHPLAEAPSEAAK